MSFRRTVVEFYRSNEGAAWRGDVRVVRAPGYARKVIENGPTQTTSPFPSTVGDAIRWPFTNVPFLLPRSSSVASWPLITMRA